MVIPVSGRVPGRTCIDDAGGLQYVFLKRVQAPRVFSLRRIYRWKGDVRGWTRRSHPLVARPGGGGRATSRCGQPLVRLLLSFGLRLRVR
jgi:hypothetical protein